MAATWLLCNLGSQKKVAFPNIFVQRGRWRTKKKNDPDNRGQSWSMELKSIVIFRRVSELLLIQPDFKWNVNGT